MINFQNLDRFLNYLDQPDLKRDTTGKIQPSSLCERICSVVSKIFTRIARVWNYLFGDHQVYNELKARKLVLNYLDKVPAEQRTKEKTLQILAIYDRLSVLSEETGTFADEDKIDKAKIESLRKSLIDSKTTEVRGSRPAQAHLNVLLEKESLSTEESERVQNVFHDLCTMGALTVDPEKLKDASKSDLITAYFLMKLFKINNASFDSCLPWNCNKEFSLAELKAGKIKAQNLVREYLTSKRLQGEDLFKAIESEDEIVVKIEDQFNALIDRSETLPFQNLLIVDETHYINHLLPSLYEGLNEGQIKEISSIPFAEELKKMPEMIKAETQLLIYTQRFVGYIKTRADYRGVPQGFPKDPFGIPKEQIEAARKLNYELSESWIQIDHGASEKRQEYRKWLNRKQKEEALPDSLKKHHEIYEEWQKTIPKELKSLPIFEAMEQLEDIKADLKAAEKEWRTIVGKEISYKATLQQLSTHLQHLEHDNVPDNLKDQHKSYTNLLKKIGSYSSVDALEIVKNFIHLQIKKEVFYLKMEERLRLSIFACRKIPSEQPVVYDLERVRSLIRHIGDMMDLCATGWLDIIERLSNAFLKSIREKKDESDLEKEAHKILGMQRREVVGQWALHWRKNGVESGKYGHAQGEALEIHFENAILEKLGKELSVPDSEDNPDATLKVPSEMESDFREFFKNEYLNVKKLIARFLSRVESSRNLKEDIAKWAQDNLLGTWKEELYKEHADRILGRMKAQLNGLQTTYQKALDLSKEEFARQVVEPVTKMISELANEQGVSINTTSCGSLFYQGFPFEELLRRLEEAVKSDLLKDRKTLFNYRIQDVDMGKMHPWVIREFLLHHKIIKLSGSTSSAG